MLIVNLAGDDKRDGLYITPKTPKGIIKRPAKITEKVKCISGYNTIRKTIFIFIILL